LQIGVHDSATRRHFQQGHRKNTPVSTWMTLVDLSTEPAHTNGPYGRKPIHSTAPPKCATRFLISPVSPVFGNDHYDVKVPRTCHKTSTSKNAKRTVKYNDSLVVRTRGHPSSFYVVCQTGHAE
jgi:hypothetical protein